MLPNSCLKLTARLALLARAAFRRYAEAMATQKSPAPASANAPGRSLSTVR